MIVHGLNEGRAIPYIITEFQMIEIQMYVILS